MAERFLSRGILSFIVLSYAGAWLVNLPLWTNDKGLQHPMAGLLLVGMMAVPAAATLLVVFVLDPEREKVRLLGLRRGPSGWWRYWALAWLGVPLCAVLAPFVGAVFGVYPVDLKEFSGFAELLKASGGEAALKTAPVEMLVVATLLSMLIAPAINAIFALGEELGWRGYLLTKLLPLGQWPALLITGTVWGLWHAPIILLGYNYPKHPVLGVLLMTVFCVILGVLFGWMRLATGSIWPAVIAHAALNGSAGAMYLFLKAGETFDTAHAGITGWSGWIPLLAWILLLVATGRLPVRHPPDLERCSQGDQTDQGVPTETAVSPEDPV